MTQPFRCIRCGATEQSAIPFSHVKDTRPEPKAPLCTPCGHEVVLGSTTTCQNCGWVHLAWYEDLGKPFVYRFGTNCRRCGRALVEPAQP